MECVEWECPSVIFKVAVTKREMFPSHDAQSWLFRSTHVRTHTRIVPMRRWIDRLPCLVSIGLKYQSSIELTIMNMTTLIPNSLSPTLTLTLTLCLFLCSSSVAVEKHMASTCEEMDAGLIQEGVCVIGRCFSAHHPGASAREGGGGEGACDPPPGLLFPCPARLLFLFLFQVFC